MMLFFVPFLISCLNHYFNIIVVLTMYFNLLLVACAVNCFHCCGRQCSLCFFPDMNEDGTCGCDRWET